MKTARPRRGAEALLAQRSTASLDLRLPDMTVRTAREDAQRTALAEVPVVVFTEGLDRSSRPAQDMAKSIVLKDVRSPERLLDETSLSCTGSSRIAAREAAMLNGCMVRWSPARRRSGVDDDARISSRSLPARESDMEVISATTAERDRHHREPGCHVVLMDI